MTTSMVDWTTAFTTATKLVKPSPEISRDGAAAVVAELRACATRAEAYVTEVTGLQADANAAPVLVVDRPNWIQANLDSFQELLMPLNEKATAKLNEGNPTLAQLGSHVTGVEVGALFSYMAPKVLGQFDPFHPGGRLLLVAPNIVAVERELELDPTDFRLWVCLHEETHRVQFTAVPWLRDYLRTLVTELVDSADLDPQILSRMVSDAVQRLLESLTSDDEISIIDLVQTPAQRETVEKVTAVMSLLEGHADIVMDRVGPEVIPTVAQIRSKFNIRRQGQGFDKIMRKLLGLDAKMRQYRDGAAFCRVVIAQAGMEGFNRVWTSVETLPTKAEIAEPLLWLERMQAAAPSSDAA